MTPHTVPRPSDRRDYSEFAALPYRPSAGLAASLTRRHHHTHEHRGLMPFAGVQRVPEWPLDRPSGNERKRVLGVPQKRSRPKLIGTQPTSCPLSARHRRLAL
jgi:hypothetical protein